MSSRQAMFKVYIGPPEGGVQVDIEGCGAWERGLNWSAQKWRGSREVLLTTVRNGRGCSVWGAQNGEGGCHAVGVLSHKTDWSRSPAPSLPKVRA